MCLHALVQTVNALRLVQTLGNYSVYVRDIKQLLLALKKEIDKGVVRGPTTSLFLSFDRCSSYAEQALRL